MTLKVRILAFSTTFTQLTVRINEFLVGWLLFLGLKEGLLECAIVCVKSWVILTNYCQGVNVLFSIYTKTKTLFSKEPPKKDQQVRIQKRKPEKKYVSKI